MLDIEIVPKAARGNGRRRQGYMQLRPPAEGESEVMIAETDMSQALQSHAVRAAAEALDVHEGTDYKDVAYYIKNVSSFSFDLRFNYETNQGLGEKN
jgi:hypothetical protein